MSSKTTTKSDQNSSNTLNYDSKSKGLYDQLSGGAGSYLQGLIQNPFGNPAFNLGAGASAKGAAQQGSNNMQALMSQMRTSGFGGKAGNAFQMAQTGRMGRANSGMSSNANLQNIFQALSRQQGAAGQAMAFQPLLTGESGKMSGTQTQTSGGLGSWLPQLIGAGLGVAGGVMTGGASTALGGIMKGASSLPASSPFGLGGNSGSMFPAFNQASPFGG